MKATVCPERGCALDLESPPEVAVKAMVITSGRQSLVTKLVIAGLLLFGLAALYAAIMFGWSGGWVGAARIFSIFIVISVIVIMLAVIIRGSK